MRSTLLLVIIGIALTACQAVEPAPTVKEPLTMYPDRAPFFASLFSGAEQYETFHRVAEIIPAKTISASPSPWQFAVGQPIQLPELYDFEGQTLGSAALLRETDTAALLVIEDGEVRFENYWLTGGQDVNWMSFSVGKSFVSALVGIALNEDLFNSVAEPITRYVPELAGSAYDNVSIKDILQMSSGARWNEDYSDPESDIMRFIIASGTGGSMDEFTATLVRENEPGTVNYYNSTDTQAIGMLLVRITGKSLSEYAEEKLFHPLGMEQDSFWITDDRGMEVAAGGLQMTARDFAKLGELYLRNGNWNGKQIISERWIDESLAMDGPHLQPGASDPHYPIGYGYQWWIPAGDEREFAAIGVYNQFIYVNPTKNLVIVKLSANSDYGTSLDASAYREVETIEFFRAIAGSLD